MKYGRSTGACDSKVSFVYRTKSYTTSPKLDIDYTQNHILLYRDANITENVNIKEDINIKRFLLSTVFLITLESSFHYQEAAILMELHQRYSKMSESCISYSFFNMRLGVGDGLKV